MRTERLGLIAAVAHLEAESLEIHALWRKAEVKLAETQVELALLEGRKVIDHIKYADNLERKVLGLTAERDALLEDIKT